VTAQIINLLRVPGVHQVMLQVQIAELNRTALREVGADWIWGFGEGNVLQTFIGARGLATVTGVFPTTDLEVALRLLRTNQLLSVLAEPNLVALSGQKASFLAGGEFPVPVPQANGGGTTITVEFKKFGVQLEFVPYVLEDETIRLVVDSEESSPDRTNAVEIEGFFVPGINTRRASTTVEMRQGQSLAIAGLLRVSLDANTSRIPGLGDLPYIGPLFSNTTHQRIEKELVILVTPVLVAPMNPDDVPCLPTDGVTDPNDLEFYLLNRIEGRTGREFSSARHWDDPWHLRQLMHLEQRCISGPIGLSPME
jgi:pilus assembly protein CpaC